MLASPIFRQFSGFRVTYVLEKCTSKELLAGFDYVKA
jgi:hypothetical protein